MLLCILCSWRAALFFLISIITTVTPKKAKSQRTAKRESKQVGLAEARGTSVAFGSREMQSPLQTVMN